MIINDIQKLKRPHRGILMRIEDEVIELDEETAVRYCLKVGSSIDEYTLKEVICVFQRHKSMEYAYKYIARKDRSESEVRDYLTKKGFTSEIIDECIDKLKSKGIVNDEKLCNYYVSKRKQTSIGRHRLLIELKNKGIDTSIVAAAVNQIDDEEEFKTAYDFVNKRFGHLNYEANIKGKIAKILERRGYSNSTIIKVVNKTFPGDVQ